jgi:hypothetical protein
MAFDAVDAHARELRAEAAHRDLAAFAGVARDHHAGTRCSDSARFRSGNRDVFGHDHVDRADLALLGVEGLVEAGPETGYHHFFDGLGVSEEAAEPPSWAPAALATLNSAVAIASFTAGKLRHFSRGFASNRTWFAPPRCVRSARCGRPTVKRCSNCRCSEPVTRFIPQK